MPLEASEEERSAAVLVILTIQEPKIWSRYGARAVGFAIAGSWRTVLSVIKIVCSPEQARAAFGAGVGVEARGGSGADAGVGAEVGVVAGTGAGAGEIAGSDKAKWNNL